MLIALEANHPGLRLHAEGAVGVGNALPRQQGHNGQGHKQSHQDPSLD